MTKLIVRTTLLIRVGNIALLIKKTVIMKNAKSLSRLTKKELLTLYPNAGAKATDLKVVIIEKIMNLPIVKPKTKVIHSVANEY